MKRNTTMLDAKDFTTKDRYYRVENNDVVRFVLGEERIEGTFETRGGLFSFSYSILWCYLPIT